SMLNGGIDLTAKVTGLLPVGNGGTGLSSGNSGGILYFSAANGLSSSSTLSANGLMIGGGAGAAPSTIAIGATNTVLHGNTGAAPSFSSIVNADIANTTIDLTTKVTGVLPVANGGTGQSTALTPGGILFGSSATVMGNTAAGSSGQILRSAG